MNKTKHRHKTQFSRVADRSLKNYKQTPEYRQCCKQLKAYGYHQRTIDIELEREVLRGRFIDFDLFFKDMTGWRGKIRQIF